MRGRQYHGIEIRHREVHIKVRTGSYTIYRDLRGCLKIKNIGFANYPDQTEVRNRLPRGIRKWENSEQHPKILIFEISSLNIGDRHAKLDLALGETTFPGPILAVPCPLQALRAALR